MLTTIVETTLQTELLPGERLLWSGQPRQGLVLRWYDAFFIPFSLLWGGLMLLAAASILSSARTAFAAVFLLPFAAVALYVTGGRFVAEAHLRRRTYYGLTNQRILIVMHVWQRHVRALHLRTLNEVQISIGRNGRGTLSFGAPGYMLGAVPMLLPFGTRYGPAAFEGIEQPREVYQQIHAAQARLLEGS